MRKITFFALTALVATVLFSTAALARGGNPGVLKSGDCSGATKWKLKVKHDDGRIETEFEVDQNRVGSTWRVVLRRNGIQRFNGFRRTRAPSGSFELRRLLGNGAGLDRIVATARNLSSGETCRGVARI